MKRRIFAWVLLVGFVLLLLNLIVFRIYWQLSMVVYLIILFAFLFTNGRTVNTQDTDDISSSDGSSGHSNDRMGRYLDDAVVLNKEADNEENSAADDTMNANDDDDDDSAAIDADDDTENK